MTNLIDPLNETAWFYWMAPVLRDDALLVEGLRGARTVGDFRRLLAMARDAGRLREQLTMCKPSDAEAQAEVDRLRAALSRYGYHDRDCQLAAREPCFCGLNAAALEGTDR